MKPDGKFHLGIEWRIYEPLAIKYQSELDKHGQFRIDGVREGFYRIRAETSDGPTTILLPFDDQDPPSDVWRGPINRRFFETAAGT